MSAKRQNSVAVADEWWNKADGWEAVVLQRRRGTVSLLSLESDVAYDLISTDCINQAIRLCSPAWLSVCLEARWIARVQQEGHLV